MKKLTRDRVVPTISFTAARSRTGGIALLSNLNSECKPFNALSGTDLSNPGRTHCPPSGNVAAFLHKREAAIQEIFPRRVRKWQHARTYSDSRASRVASWFVGAMERRIPNLCLNPLQPNVNTGVR